MSAIRVLVVDDHDLFRVGLASALQGAEDIEVVAHASGGRAGVRLARELRPDVVLMELRMSDVSGLDVTRKILSDRPSTRVVVLTPSREQGVEEALRAGACGVLAKDTPIEEVVTAVRAAAQGTAWLSASAAVLLLGRMRDADREKRSDRRPADELSARELDVLQLIAGGLDGEQIAAKLDLRPRTARNYVASIIQRSIQRRPGPGPGTRFADVEPGDGGSDPSLRCSFCSKTTGQVEAVIAGPKVAICSDCVALCVEVLAEKGAPGDGSPAQ